MWSFHLDEFDQLMGRNRAQATSTERIWYSEVQRNFQKRWCSRRFQTQNLFVGVAWDSIRERRDGQRQRNRGR